MSNAIEESLAELNDEFGNPDYLLVYVSQSDEPVEIVESDDGLEPISIQHDQDGNIVVTSSRKLSNVRFKLGNFLMAAVGAGFGVAGSLNNPAKLAFTAISFLWKLRKMAYLEIRPEDGEVLLAIFRLHQEEATVQRSAILPNLNDNWGDDSLFQALLRLEDLGCIELNGEEVHLNETIVLVSEA